MTISDEAKEVILRIYIGQNVREYGLLQGDVQGKEQVKELLSNDLIKENRAWSHLNLFLTTQKGSELGKQAVLARIKERSGQLDSDIQEIPKRALAFLVKRCIMKKFLSPDLAFSTEKPRWSDSWEDRVLADGRIWLLWRKLLSALEAVGLSIKAHSYVGTRGGETRDLCYVISPEIQSYLVEKYTQFDFAPNEEDTLKLYPVLLSVSRVLRSADADYSKQELYQLLRDHSVEEGQLAGIINDMSMQKMTSEYRGLLSEDKPFDVIADPTRFQLYLDKNLVEPAVNMLLSSEGKIREYSLKVEMPALSLAKIELGLLDRTELGEFYILVSDLERRLRQFLKEKLGKGWMKKIEHDFPAIVENWQKRKLSDKNQGIEPEEDLMNYADLEDYIQIIRKYDRMFADNNDDLGTIITYLRIWYNQGRNPIMHIRTVNRKKYFTTKSAIEFLDQWMRRKG